MMQNKEDVFKKEMDRILVGLEEAYRRMAIFKKRNNYPLVVSKNGKVVSIPPDEIPPTTRYWRKIKPEQT